MGLVKFLKRKLIRCQSPAAVAVDHPPKKADSDGRFSWEEIQRLTSDFATVLGYGGFSTVYLAQFRHSAAAVKVYCSSGGSQRVYDAFRQELQILLHLRHPNIVKLLGYAGDRGALVMEFVPGGTLHHRLHESHAPLTWSQRAAVAFQLAAAVAYLHEICAPHIVHADIKPSNVLLDADLNCKLCDFGSARVGFSSAVAPPSSGKRRSAATVITGSPGYTDPLYLRTGLVSKKNDVYSFGVVLLELITGIEAFSPATGERLAARAAPLVVDPRLRLGEAELGEARALAALAAKCISETPGVRPSASGILTAMREAIPALSFVFEKKLL